MTEDDDLFGEGPDRPKLDIEKYRPYLDEFDMTDEQKDDFLYRLWGFMSYMVDRMWNASEEEFDELRELSRTSHAETPEQAYCERVREEELNVFMDQWRAEQENASD